MTQKQVLTAIIGLMKDEMAMYGFKPSYKEYGFIKKTGDAIFLYQLLIYNRTLFEANQTGFLIEPYVWINIREIEKYYKQISLNTELRAEVDYKTIGNSVADILANPDGFYKQKNKSLNLYVFKEAEIAGIASRLIEIFSSIGVKYFVENSSVKRVDEIVNAAPSKSKVHMQNDNYRLIKGLIAAKLNKNPNCETLIKLYESEIEKNNMYNAINEMARLKMILAEIQ
jgi:hypothetical protein